MPRRDKLEPAGHSFVRLRSGLLTPRVFEHDNWRPVAFGILTIPHRQRNAGGARLGRGKFSFRRREACEALPSPGLRACSSTRAATMPRRGRRGILLG
jgi:hypothetical protein